MSKSNVVSLSIPKDKTMIDKFIAVLRERDIDSIVMFAINKDGSPFIAHSSYKTVSKLIIYLEAIKGMLMDEVIAVDAAGIITYNEEKGESE